MLNSHYVLIRRHKACRHGDCVFNQIPHTAERIRNEKRKKSTMQNKLSKQQHLIQLGGQNGIFVLCVFDIMKIYENGSKMRLLSKVLYCYVGSGP